MRAESGTRDIKAAYREMYQETFYETSAFKESCRIIFYVYKLLAIIKTDALIKTDLCSNHFSSLKF